MVQKLLHIAIQGIVQGVGFRPFVYQLATDLKLVGWVNNSARGVEIEVEGSQSQLENFLLRLDREKPVRSHIQSLEVSWLDATSYDNFEIRPSTGGEKTATIMPDISTCSECLQDIFTPTNRRYRYPFTNCTHCGPRFSIIEALPYDRSHTTMKHFQMCVDCQAEYENPLNRRFHAQPNACPQCGPYLELWNREGKVLASRDTALQMTVNAIRNGNIVAIKGLGGFHLVVDARNKEAIKQLRVCKQRAEKPFALMYPNIDLVKAHCEVSELEERLLRSPEAPIVLLRRRKHLGIDLAEGEFSVCPIDNSSIAPHNPYLGVMLPYTPLHHLLMIELGVPIVATSGNLANETIYIHEHEAIEQLGNFINIFLVHNRPIARPVDDSILKVIQNRELMLRRARGYAPLPISLHPPPAILNCQSKILAVGAHLKNTIAVATNKQVFISQHIGDLDTVSAFENFSRTIASFQELYEMQPNIIASDLHPDYRSTQFANQFGVPVIPIQHHYAHVLSCMAENQIQGSVLGVAWDGTGYGLDGTTWGGEFLYVTDTAWQRVAHLHTFRLPGGEKAIKEPRRSALGLLYEIFGNTVFEMPRLAPIQAFSIQELKILKAMLERQVNTPLISSCGRLFDAIASILDLCHQTEYEGQAAIALELAIDETKTDEYYNFQILKLVKNKEHPSIVIDWRVTIKEILVDIGSKVSCQKIAAKFHNTLVEVIISVAQYMGEKRIVLTGGCFQNKTLIERAIDRLREENFYPYWHQYIPPNDGGIALGQIIATLRNTNQL
ncbi:carbamoyltransferase HypF [Scytonema sp. UIC 10036]|uniref:carbamoyltransferase HypF n=1 Tax=Scytonema sp. UIC 10036 TaxID=2304196 RepID=UPI0012DAE68C|nr:carbamoyltransferase HypF [Scytonema sp. UIC 10036]MUG98575.1 carbamoyltransferase HypF [Scytonema sp. UIC 10036]